MARGPVSGQRDGASGVPSPSTPPPRAVPRPRAGSGAHAAPASRSPAHSTEETLLRVLYDQHAGPLLAFVLRLTGGDRQRAEDIVQETLLRAWRNAHKLGAGGERSLRPWLVTVARRIAIDDYRSDSARPVETYDRDLQDFPSADETDQVLRMLVVTEALRALSPAHREILVETYLAGAYRGRGRRGARARARHGQVEGLLRAPRAAGRAGTARGDRNVTSSSEHWEVASYALGVLDSRDVPGFEAHLAECDQCADELARLLPVAALLSTVEAERQPDAAPSPSTVDEEGPDRLLRRMVRTVAEERRRSRRRAVLTLAAGVVAMLVLVGLAYAVGGGPGGAPVAPQALPSTTATPPAVTLVSPRPSDPGSGIGGPGEGDGERFEVTDPATGVRMRLALGTRSWGTEVSLSLASLAGPLVKCQLVAIDQDGDTEVVATWQVPAEGYGTPAHPAPLLVQAATALPRPTLRGLEVRSVEPSGVAVTLAQVRV